MLVLRQRPQQRGRLERLRQQVLDITGLDLIRLVKTRRPDLPCILCTGLGKPDGEAEASAAGADAYLQKPIAPGVLEAVVTRLLGARATRG